MRFGLAPVVVLAAVLLTSAPDAAHAQPPLERGSWLATGFAGWALDGDGDSSLTLAGSATYPLTPVFAIEGELGHVFDLVPGDDDIDSSLTTVHAAGLYFFNTSYKMTPYAAAGIGFGNQSTSVDSTSESSSANEVGFNVGGGVTYPLGNALYFRGDIRFYKHTDEIPSVWRFAAGITVKIGM
jgi:opacity protein-like surface antigen